MKCETSILRKLLAVHLFVACHGVVDGCSPVFAVFDDGFEQLDELLPGLDVVATGNEHLVEQVLFGVRQVGQHVNDVFVYLDFGFASVQQVL